jgi:hypothetical protein
LREVLSGYRHSTDPARFVNPLSFGSLCLCFSFCQQGSCPRSSQRWVEDVAGIPDRSLTVSGPPVVLDNKCTEGGSASLTYFNSPIRTFPVIQSAFYLVDSNVIPTHAPHNHCDEKGIEERNQNRSELLSLQAVLPDDEVSYAQPINQWE